MATTESHQKCLGEWNRYIDENWTCLLQTLTEGILSKSKEITNSGPIVTKKKKDTAFFGPQIIYDGQKLFNDFWNPWLECPAG